jgi:uncharacterized membrane protein
VHTSKKPAAAACGVCGRESPISQLLPVDHLRAELGSLIENDKPDWRATGYVCQDDVLKYRHRYISEMLRKERSELSALDKTVIASIAKQETLTENVEASYDEHISLGDRWADRIAGFGGSWYFIGLFGAVVLGWIALNLVPLFGDRFDPYPFILLNLVLSCIAALQAPFIMMSQRRLETKDRLRSQNDYRVNLKAELEIRLLHEKLDHLLLKQWQRLAEIQQIQMEIMEDIAHDRKKAT